jgi:hypothetical protein
MATNLTFCRQIIAANGTHPPPIIHNTALLIPDSKLRDILTICRFAVKNFAFSINHAAMVMTQQVCFFS